MCLLGKSAYLETDTVSGCGRLVIVQILKGIRHPSGCAWLVIVQIFKGIRYRDVAGW